MVRVRTVTTGGTTSDRLTLFDLSNGTTPSSSHSKSVITSDLFGDDWYLCRITDPLSAGNTSLNILISSETPGDFYVDTAQSTESSIMSSYIPTTTSPVLRGADDVSINAFENSPILSGSLTITLDAKPLEPTSSDMFIINLSSDDDFNRGLAFRRDGGGVTTYVSGSSFVAATNTDNKITLVSTYDGIDRVKCYSDGVEILNSAKEFTDNNIASTIYIGKRIGSDNHMYGHVNNIKIYDFEFSSFQANFI